MPNKVMKTLIVVFLFLVVVLCCKKSDTGSTPAPFSIQSFTPAQGIVGTTVTIQGIGFSIDPTKNVVKFGGGVATITTAATTQLVMTVPATAQTGKITVEANGLTTTSATDFTLLRAPSIASFSPEQSEEGDEIDIKGDNFTNNTIVKFNGVAAKTIIRVGATELKAIVPDEAKTGKITVEDVGISATSAKVFTVIIPLSAKATVTKLAGIPAFASTGADGVRMLLTNELYITGPAQNTVYKMNLTTFTVTSFLTNINRPISISSDLHYYIGGFDSFNAYVNGTTLNKIPYPSQVTGGFYSLKTAPKHPTIRMYGIDFSNTIIAVLSTSGNPITTAVSSYSPINTQLQSTINNGSAMLGTSSKSTFVFANHALWQLETPSSPLKLVAGFTGKADYVDGAGAAARFQDGGYGRGNAIAVDESDNVYVADYGSGCIRKVDASGNVSTVVGNKKLLSVTGSAKVGKGNRMAFRFDSWDIALTTDGTLYVIANNDVESTTLRYAIYKVTFDK